MGAEEENRNLLAAMEVGARGLRSEGYAEVRVAALREDWAAPRARAEEEIRAAVAAMGERWSRVVVIPYRVSGFGPYAQVLDGLDSVPAGSLLPHALVTEWVRERVRATLCSEDTGYDIGQERPAPCCLPSSARWGSGLMIRGIGGPRVLVLVDGRPAAGALLENRDLSRVSLAGVERVGSAYSAEVGSHRFDIGVEGAHRAIRSPDKLMEERVADRRVLEPDREAHRAGIRGGKPRAACRPTRRGTSPKR